MVTAGLTACLEALQTARTPAQDVRGAATCLELRPGALGAAAALVQRVLAALTTGGRGGALQGITFISYRGNICKYLQSLLSCPVLILDNLSSCLLVLWLFEIILEHVILEHAKAARVQFC